MPDLATEQVVFPLLADPASYRPCAMDLLRDANARAYWLGLFRRHFDTLLRHYEEEAADRDVPPPPPPEEVAQRSGLAQQRFFHWLDRVSEQPDAFGPLDVLHICWAREDVLDEAGIDDAYRLAKRRENDKALSLLPALLDELDAMPDEARRLAVAEGILAGNIYDLGATTTIDLYNAGRTDFHAVRAKLKPRPWFCDGIDAWCSRLDNPYRAAVLFVDNAGPDVTLGMLPLARELLKQGTAVVLTANTLPALNDITHDELVPLVQRAAGFDAVFAEALREDRLRIVPSGNRAPLIDLRSVSRELAEVCESLPVELVVLEGMGRGIESNFDAELRCDTLKVAMVKDEQVARMLGASVFDLVFRFDPAK